MDDIVDDWLTMVDDTQLDIIPFGKGQQPDFELFGCYEHYFNVLLENVQLMRSEHPSDAQFMAFL